MHKVYVLHTIMYTTYVCVCAAVGVLWLSAAGLEGLIRLRSRQAYAGRSVRGLVASSLGLVFIGA